MAWPLLLLLRRRTAGIGLCRRSWRLLLTSTHLLLLLLTVRLLLLLRSRALLLPLLTSQHIDQLIMNALQPLHLCREASLLLLLCWAVRL